MRIHIQLFVEEKGIDGIAFPQDRRIASRCPLRNVGSELFNLIPVVRYVKISCPTEILCFHIRGMQAQLNPFVAHRPVVLEERGKAGTVGNGHIQQEVVGIFIVIVEINMQAVFEDGKLNAQVNLAGGFPSQVGISQLVGGNTRRFQISGICRPQSQSGVRADTVLIARITETAAKFECVKHMQLLDEIFQTRIPCNPRGGEVTPAVVFPEAGRGIGADTAVQRIFPVQHIARLSEERQQAALGSTGRA
ncbi:hypothetical protein Barb7_02673 [Bacteroidales bacterium Barb7]|nr:hypothetical protein Barb7_02673 [Bacteroidales bacterium Barb7]